MKGRFKDSMKKDWENRKIFKQSTQEIVRIRSEAVAMESHRGQVRIRRKTAKGYRCGTRGSPKVTGVLGLTSGG